MINGIKVVSTGFLHEIINGDVDKAKAWVKLGYNGAVSTSIEYLTSVGTTFAPISTGLQLEVVSSSADDTIAGDGAQKVIIYYLDEDYIEHTEEIELDGLTPVATVATDIFRINGFKVSQVGTDLYPAGDIDLRTIGGTPIIYSEIPAGYNTARDFIYTVPANKTLYITNINYSSNSAVANKSCRITLIADYDVEAGVSLVSKSLYMPVTELSLQNQSHTQELSMPIKFPEKTTFLIRVIADGTSVASAKAVGYII